MTLLINNTLKSSNTKPSKNQDLVIWLEFDVVGNYANITSAIDVKVCAKRLSKEATSKFGFDAQIDINGKKLYKTSAINFNSSMQGSVVLTDNNSKFSIVHNQDGTKTVPVSVELDVYYDYWDKQGENDYGSCSLEFNLELPKLPALPTIIFPNNITIGEAQTLSIDYELVFCEHLINIKTEKNGDSGYCSIGWTKKHDFIIDCFRLKQMNEGDHNGFWDTFGFKYEADTSGSGTIELHTSLDSVLINTSKDYTFTIPNSVKPKGKSITSRIINTNSNYESANQAYIKNVCKAELTFDFDPYYATYTASRYKSYRIWSENSKGETKVLVYGNFNYDSDSDFSPKDAQGNPLYPIKYTTDTLKEAGEITFYADITDYRGRVSDPVGVRINVIDHDVPSVSYFSCERSNSNAESDEEGDYIKCEYEASIPSLNNTNTILFKIDVYDYKDGVLSSDPIDTIYLSNSSYNISGVELIGNKPYYNNYALVFTAQDKDVAITSSVEYVFASDALIDIDPYSGGIAIGKMSRSDSFEVAMKQINYDSIVPSENNKYDLGGSYNRWKTIYAVNSLNTSDATFKENITYVSLSNKSKSGAISEEDLHNFYKSDYQLATYNYVGQPQIEYGFITQDLYDNSVGESLLIKNKEGDMFSINSYVSSIAGALQYEINLRDEQIDALTEIVEELKKKIDDLTQ